MTSRRRCIRHEDRIMIESASRRNRSIGRLQPFLGVNCSRVALLNAPAAQLTHLRLVYLELYRYHPMRYRVSATPQSPSPPATTLPYVCSIQQKHAKLRSSSFPRLFVEHVKGE